MDKEILSVGSIIKKFIVVRGYTVKEVAAMIGTPYTTFNGVLNRDSIDVYLLFKLKRILDIDLEWLANIVDMGKGISTLDPMCIPRMQEELRQHDIEKVLDDIDQCIKNNPESVAATRNEILSCYNQYYLLDMIMPDEIEIQVIYDRQKPKYYCLQPSLGKNGRRGYMSLVPGKEMIDRYIAERRSK